MWFSKILFVSGLGALMASPGFAADQKNQKNPTNNQDRSKYERAGGTYTVSKIDQQDNGSFIVEFTSAAKTGKFDVIKLESDHVHTSVNVGATLRLSAEIVSVKDAVAEASQILIFIPNAQGHMPVWLLSRKSSGLDLRGSKYLEMHNPQSDYTIM